MHSKLFRFLLRTTVFSILAPAFFAAVARAQVIETDQEQGNSGYTILTGSDLLLNAAPISSAGNFTFGGGSVSVLTDGSFGSGGDETATASAGAAGDGSGAGSEVAYSLGSNPSGYDISEIQTYSGWPDDGRYQQAYTVSYSLVSDTNTFINLYTVNAYPSSTFGANEAFVDLTPTSGLLASGVADIEFTFNSVANGWTGYRELVVNGTPTAAVPEPNTWAMVIGGAGTLLVFRRRRFR